MKKGTGKNPQFFHLPEKGNLKIQPSVQKNPFARDQTYFKGGGGVSFKGRKKITEVG